MSGETLSSPKTTLYFKQTLFLISDIKLYQNSESRNIEAFLTYPNHQSEEIPLSIAHFPYLAMGKIKINQCIPTITVHLKNAEMNQSKQIIITPQYSTVISAFVSINSVTPDFENFVFLYRSFLSENQKIPVNLQTVKICKNFIIKPNKYKIFSQLFTAASFLLREPVEFEYLHIYSQLRMNGKIRKINELVDYSNVLYKYLINNETSQRFLNNASQKDNFKLLFEYTIGDILDDLEKAELYGAHSSILYLTCLYLDIFNSNKSLNLPHNWHFMPIELVKRDFQTHTGQFLPDNFTYVLNTIYKHPISSILGYSPLYHNDIMKTLSSLLSKTSLPINDVLIFFGLKLNQLFIYESSTFVIHRKHFIYLYSIPNDQIIDQFCKLLFIFIRYNKEKNININMIQKFFPSKFWPTLIKCISYIDQNAIP